MFALDEVNYLGTAIAAAAAWMFGAAYYGLLGRAWIAAQGRTKESLAIENAGKSAAAKAAPFLLSFVGELLMAFVMYGILTHLGMFNLRAGMISGAFCWVGFVLPTVAINNAYSGRRVMLTVIDAGHWLGVLVIIGGIVGAWGP
ncbi:MAG: DUF1761 domain-containing protein [Pseudolabrys sp.]|nr:DUF1761 domain-containing protein [Pseudolabrys sp.]MDP2296374.1 DUF1761 domain-containing protein [Pseudolabrys sp.]